MAQAVRHRPLIQKASVRSRLVHVRSKVHKVALGQVSVRVLHFPLSGPFHQCSTLTIIYKLLLP
jgi:hypothetical protein